MVVRGSPPVHKALRALAWTIVGSVGGSLLGCQSTPTNQDRTESLRANGLTATTQPSTDRRVGMVFTGHGFHFSREVEDFHGTHGRTHVEIYACGTSNGDAGRRGTVTAIDRRGYYLTAAHAVSGDPLWVCCGGTIRPARVVFRGDDDFDLAILAVDRPIPDAFDWANHADEYAPGKVVVEWGPTDPTGQYSPAALYVGHLSMQRFAGRVCDVDESTSGDGGYELVSSTLPARRGDSGGPVMTPDGELVAIFVKFNLLLARSYAVRPDPAWIRDVVEQDFIAYRSASPTTSPTTAFNK